MDGWMDVDACKLQLEIVTNKAEKRTNVVLRVTYHNNHIAA